ncbi:hypothetical protein ACWKSP_35280 [Micromonosporaceae bacterium Da 78-11]
MNKATRALAMAGMAVAAGATIGAGPAFASPSTPSTTESGKTAAAAADRGRTVGYFRSANACFRAANINESRSRFLDFECSRVRFGPRRGWVALTVHRDNWQGGNFDGWGHHRGWGDLGNWGRPGGWGNGPGNNNGGWGNGPGGPRR